jgi:hypothetical protein
MCQATIGFDDGNALQHAFSDRAVSVMPSGVLAAAVTLPLVLRSPFCIDICKSNPGRGLPAAQFPGVPSLSSLATGVDCGNHLITLAPAK